MIMFQPDKFHDQIHEPQHGHWDKGKQKNGDYTLVYLRPVVYRSYHGKQASISKGWVAMEGVNKEGKEQWWKLSNWMPAALTSCTGQGGDIKCDSADNQ